VTGGPGAGAEAGAEDEHVAAALAVARARGLDRLDAQLLLGHVLRRSRAWLIAHDDDLVDAAHRERFDALCAARASGVPIAYLLGRREFRGLDLAVGPGVLVPRPDTETLVEWAVDRLDGPLAGRARPRVLDLGTGSGAIALAVKAATPRSDVLATDASLVALAQARENARRLGLDVGFAAGRWWQALPRDGAPFDLVVSNPPYIAPGDPHLDALVHEPIEALVAADDGLADLAAIVEGAAPHLAPGGWLLLEHGWTQAPAVAALLAATGFVDIGHRHDIEARPRCTGGRRPLADAA
jgi:release factor glutamine methyltransferase